MKMEEVFVVLSMLPSGYAVCASVYRSVTYLLSREEKRGGGGEGGGGGGGGEEEEKKKKKKKMFVSIEEAAECFSCVQEKGKCRSNLHKEIAFDELKIDTRPGSLQGSFEPYAHQFLILACGESKRWTSKLEEGKDANSFFTNMIKTVRGLPGQDHPKGKGEEVTPSFMKCTAAEGLQESVLNSKRHPEVLCLTRGLTFVYEKPEFSSVEDQRVFIKSILDVVAGEKTDAGVALTVAYPQVSHYVLICVHESRDKRCGHVGPLLKQEFDVVLQLKKLSEKVRVFTTSHVGGHAFAGNVIVYTAADAVGHWYGLVTPCHVSGLVETHILAGQVVKDLWRGSNKKMTM
jgi:(2Fe-2S) ferredoxin